MDGTRTPSRWLWRVLLGAAGAAAAVAATAAGAQAGGSSGGGETESGYYVEANVVLSGDAAPGGGGTQTMSLPAQCWWTINTEIPYGDVEAVKAWYAQKDAELTGTFTGALYMYGRVEEYVAVAERQAAGEALNWYVAKCRDDAQDKLIEFTGESYVWGVNGDVAVNYQPFVTGNPPEPDVDPEDLALLAYGEMVLVDPAVDRNPVSEVAGGATFVGLDTWFWVTDPASVGGATGTRTIRAQVGDVWAEVVATTDGLTITSPGGGTECTPEQAQVRYSAGASAAAACTLTFARASVGYSGGYPVEASAAWQAQWTASDGDGGGLAGRTADSDVLVPVAESQAIVVGGR